MSQFSTMSHGMASDQNDLMPRFTAAPRLCTGGTRMRDAVSIASPAALRTTRARFAPAFRDGVGIRTLSSPRQGGSDSNRRIRFPGSSIPRNGRRTMTSAYKTRVAPSCSPGRLHAHIPALHDPSTPMSAMPPGVRVQNRKSEHLAFYWLFRVVVGRPDRRMDRMRPQPARI